MKMKKIIGSSLATIALATSLATGATYALFTSSSDVNIAISAGKVKVSAYVDENSIETSSVVFKDNGYVDVPMDPKNVFSNGGTVSVVNNELIIDRITPGDGVKLNLVIENQSNVNVKYRTIVIGDSGNTLFEGLVRKINNLPYNGLVCVSDFDDLASGDTVVPVEFALPVDANNTYQELSTAIKFIVEAVQGNAGDGYKSTYLTQVGSLAEFKDALVSDTQIIKLTNDISVFSGETIVIPANKTIAGEGFKLDLTGTVVNPAPAPKRLGDLGGEIGSPTIPGGSPGVIGSNDPVVVGPESQLVIGGSNVLIRDLAINVGAKPVLVENKANVQMQDLVLNGTDKTATAMVVQDATAVLTRVQVSLPNASVPEDIKVVSTTSASIKVDGQEKPAVINEDTSIDEFVDAASNFFQAINEVETLQANANDQNDVIKAYEKLKEIDTTDIPADLAVFVVVKNNEVTSEILNDAENLGLMPITISFSDSEGNTPNSISTLPGANILLPNLFSAVKVHLGWKLSGADDSTASMNFNSNGASGDVTLVAVWSQSKGDGSAATPYLLTVSSDLSKLSTNGEHYELVNNINLRSENWTPVDFKGTLDGNKNTIRLKNINGVVNSIYTNHALFNNLSGEVKHLNLDVDFDTNIVDSTIAALAVTAKDVTVADVKVTGTLKAAHAAGVINAAESNVVVSSVQNSANLITKSDLVNVSGGYNASLAGGIIGKVVVGSKGIEFVNTSNYGNITATYRSDLAFNAGQMIGYVGVDSFDNYTEIVLDNLGKGTGKIIGNATLQGNFTGYAYTAKDVVSTTSKNNGNTVDSSALIGYVPNYQFAVINDSSNHYQSEAKVLFATFKSDMSEKLTVAKEYTIPNGDWPKAYKIKYSENAGVGTFSYVGDSASDRKFNAVAAYIADVLKLADFTVNNVRKVDANRCIIALNVPDQNDSTVTHMVAVRVIFNLQSVASL